MTERTHERSAASLAGDVLNDVTTLLKTEGELARAEMKRNVNEAIAGLVSIMVAGAVLLSSLTVALIALAYALTAMLELAPWLSHLIAAVIGVVIGLVLLASARAALKASSIAPTRTAENIRKDVNAAKEGLS